MSASVDTDVCVGRCGCLRRSVRMTHIAQTHIKKPRFTIEKRGFFVGGYGILPYPRN
ncbi:hypothetical protein [Leyella stercorea]|uniref:hypothetical protein n=1 Tax=Leyella stercorea TaxID=363265 RepID=UPI002673C8FD|nr:hypothetical protein [Leyella stercorea]